MYPNQPTETPPVNPPAEQPVAPPPAAAPTQSAWTSPPVNEKPAGQTVPLDYLNQIAPQAPKKSMFNLGIKQMIMIGVGLITLVIILSIVATSLAGGKKEPLEHLAARLTATEAIAIDAQKNLKSSQLRSLNSNLKLYMANTNGTIAPPLLSAGVNTAKISKSITASESTTALSAKLEDARLNAVYDRTYAREMAYQLGTLLTLMSEIYNSTGNDELKTFLKSAYDNLEPTQQSFADFTTTN